MSKLEDLVKSVGYDRACEILEKAAGGIAGSTLTIVANKGVHHLPDECVRGEIFYASEGNLDFSSIDAVRKQYVDILAKLASKLKSASWKEIYIVPFGHNTLSMQIKLLVYRVTRIETTDLFYDGKGGYCDLSIDQREIIVLSDK
jgi:hypothetical protein